MRITGVKTARLGGSSACLRIDTDEGIRGFGEATVETVPDAVIAAVHRIAEKYLIGQDPRPVELHRRRMQDALWYHADAVVSSALTGIDHALWDIKGQALGVPVYELLGGPVRERVRVYRWIGERSRKNLPEQARRRVAEGLTAIKFSPTGDDPPPYPRCVEEARRIVCQVREAVGPEVDLMLDPASRWKLAEARHILSALEEFQILFAEDFISPHCPETVARLAESTRIPYALGDRLIGFRDFDELIRRDAAAVLQPDIGHAGGLLEIKAIALAAEQRGIRMAPHNALGPVATAAAIHLDLAIPNFLIQEIAGTEFFGSWDLGSYVDAEILTVRNGYINAPRRPGLGVTIADEVFEGAVAVNESPFFGDARDFHVPEW